MPRARLVTALLTSIVCSTQLAYSHEVPSQEQLLRMLPALNKRLKTNPKEFLALMQRLRA